MSTSSCKTSHPPFENSSFAGNASHRSVGHGFTNVPSSVLSPPSSLCSSVFDNPGAAPRSPPRTPQLYARNMSTPNANAYKIHGSPYTPPPRKSSFTEAQHARQTNLDRPSTLNLNLGSSPRTGMSCPPRCDQYGGRNLFGMDGDAHHKHGHCHSATSTPEQTPPGEM